MMTEDDLKSVRATIAKAHLQAHPSNIEAALLSHCTALLMERERHWDAARNDDKIKAIRECHKHQVISSSDVDTLFAALDEVYLCGYKAGSHETWVPCSYCEHLSTETDACPKCGTTRDNEAHGGE